MTTEQDDASDRASAAVSRLPRLIQESVRGLLDLRATALAEAEDTGVLDGDRTAASVMANAYDAALRVISDAFDAPDLNLSDDADDEPESVDGPFFLRGNTGYKSQIADTVFGRFPR